MDLIGLYKNNGAVSCVSSKGAFLSPAPHSVRKEGPIELWPAKVKNAYGRIGIFPLYLATLPCQN